MDTKEKIKVMQAHIDGKEIEFKRISDGIYWEKSDDIRWDWYQYEYRVKPEHRRTWVNFYNNENVGYAHNSKQEAVNSAGTAVVKTVEFIEVIK